MHHGLCVQDQMESLRIGEGQVSAEVEKLRSRSVNTNPASSSENVYIYIVYTVQITE